MCGQLLLESLGQQKHAHGLSPSLDVRVDLVVVGRAEDAQVRESVAVAHNVGGQLPMAPEEVEDERAYRVTGYEGAA